MTYVDGVFSGRRPKRRALTALALIAGASFATGVVRHAGPDRFTFAAPAPPTPEMGVALAQPYVEPRPMLQATAPARRAAVRVPRPSEELVLETAAVEPVAAVGEGADVAVFAPAPQAVAPPLPLEAAMPPNTEAPE